MTPRRRGYYWAKLDQHDPLSGKPPLAKPAPDPDGGWETYYWDDDHELKPEDLQRQSSGSATAAKRAKINKWFTADLLAHAATSVTDGYDMTDVEDLREPLTTVTTRLLALCEGKVTPLRKAA
jgi:hypothetical protein